MIHLPPEQAEILKHLKVQCTESRSEWTYCFKRCYFPYIQKQWKTSPLRWGLWEKVGRLPKKSKLFVFTAQNPLPSKSGFAVNGLVFPTGPSKNGVEGKTFLPVVYSQAALLTYLSHPLTPNLPQPRLCSCSSKLCTCPRLLPLSPRIKWHGRETAGKLHSPLSLLVLWCNQLSHLTEKKKTKQCDLNSALG